MFDDEDFEYEDDEEFEAIEPRQNRLLNEPSFGNYLCTKCGRSGDENRFIEKINCITYRIFETLNINVSGGK